MHAHHATLENANNRQMRGAVHAVCCICWVHRTHYAFRILHRSPTLILDTLKQDARKYFVHAHGVSGEGQSPDHEGEDFRQQEAEPRQF